MNQVINYISGLYKNNNVVNKKDFEAGTTYKFYCPVIDTSIAGFLDILIKIVKPQKVLELGTSIGYSTTIIANAMKTYKAKLTTIELDKRVAKAAIENFKKYEVEENINLINGNAIEVIKNLDTKYDFIFLDLYNGLYLEVIDRCLEMLNHGGILFADDTLFPVVRKDNIFEESNKKLQIFNEKIVADDSIYSYMLPIDDGVTMIVKK